MPKKFYIYGEDTYRARMFITSIFPVFRIVDEKEQVPKEITNLHQLGLFGEQIPVVFNDVTDTLLPFLSELSVSTSDWIVWEQNKKVSLKKKEQNEVERVAEIKQFAPLAAGDAKQWIQAHAKEKNINISWDVVNVLYTIHGNNLSFLVHELQMLALLTDTIDVATVQKHCKPTVEATSFGLIDVLASKGHGGSFKELNILFDTLIDPWLLFFSIVKHFRYLLQANSGLPISAHPFVQKKVSGQLKYWKREELVNVMTDLQEMETSVKKGEIDLRTALQVWTNSLVLGPTST